jgi:hypothetical protein
MNTIVGKAYVNIRDEKDAGGAITPGHLVERNSSDEVVVHSTAGGDVNPLFALEDELQGKEISEAYASGDKVFLWRPVPGEQVYAIAEGAIAIGEFVESNGDGTLIAFSSGSTEAVGVALEAAADGDRFLVEIH